MTSLGDPAPHRRPPTCLLTGIPRSGSSLACRLAGELPDVVALSEPMPRADFAGLVAGAEALAVVERFAARTRARIATHRRAPSLQVRGRLDDNVVASDAEGGLRRRQAEQGEIDIDKPLSDRFALLIKHNALFAALLPQLATFRCLALVRNPLVVLASWQTVDLPVHRGRIPAGEQFDPDLRQTLDRASSSVSRQLIVLNWFFAAYADNLPAERILRYEDLIATGGATLFERLGHPDAPTQPLASRDDHAAYRDVAIDELYAALVDTGGAWTRFYDAADCARAADALSVG